MNTLLFCRFIRSLRHFSLRGRHLNVAAPLAPASVAGSDRHPLPVGGTPLRRTWLWLMTIALAAVALWVLIAILSAGLTNPAKAVTMATGPAADLATTSLPPSAPSSLSLAPALYLVDENDQPIANTTVRILCFAAMDSGINDDLTVQTDGLGRPIVTLSDSCNYAAAMRLHHEQPSGKPRALPAYSIYSTSWPPYGDERVEITGTSTISIMIPSTQPLVLFDVIASLAWEPGEGNNYVDNLEVGLAEASKYLYDATNGIMAFGRTEIYANGSKWQGADIRVLPGNDVRPSAQVGGIVPSARTYAPPNAPAPTEADQIAISTVYTPGSIFLGRNWSADLTVYNNANPKIQIIGAQDSPIVGNWEQGIGARTIVHEWAHYALFLYDEYQTASGQKAYCTGPQNRNEQNLETNRSIMDSPYTATELWHPDDPTWGGGTGTINAGTCMDTKQYNFHHATDCETLAMWYEIQGLPNSGELPQLNCRIGSDRGFMTIGLTNYLLDSETTHIRPYKIFMPHLAGSSAPPLAVARAALTDPANSANRAETVDAKLEAAAAIESAHLATQVYHLFGEGAEERQPYRADNILHQGQIISTLDKENWHGRMTLLGVHQELDDIHVFAEKYVNPKSMDIAGRWYGREVAQSPMQVELTETPWHATLDAEYEVNSYSQLVTMTVYLTIPLDGPVVPLTEKNPPMAQLCNPAEELRCHEGWLIEEMTPVSTSSATDVWKATFTPVTGTVELPRYGIVRVEATYPDPIVGSELIRWYRISGVGPGGHNANAPGPDMNDEVVTLSSSGPPIRHCNQVVFMPSAHYDALTVPLPVLADEERTVAGILGQAYDIAVRLPDDREQCPESFGLNTATFEEAVGQSNVRAMSQTQTRGQHFVNGDIVLTIFYPFPLAGIENGLVPPLGEANLRVIYLDPVAARDPEKNQRQWEIIEPIDSNDAENWISIPFLKDGIYAVGWVE